MGRALLSVELFGRIVVAILTLGALGSTAVGADPAPLTLPRDQRPEWVQRDGIVMAGSWEPLAFRVRRDGKSYTPNAKQLADWRREHSPEMVQRLKSIGVKVVPNVDKSGFIKVATPYLEKFSTDLGPHAVKIEKLITSIQ